MGETAIPEPKPQRFVSVIKTEWKKKKCSKSAVMPAPSIPFLPPSKNPQKVQKAFCSLKSSSQLHLDCNLDIELTENTSRCFVTLLSNIVLYSRERENEKDLTGWKPFERLYAL